MRGEPGQPEMTKLAVCISQAQHEHRPAHVAGNAHDHAIGGPLLFDLYPPALAGQIAAVVTFGHHAFDATQPLEPILRFRNCRRLDYELQAGVIGLEQRFQLGRRSARCMSVRSTPW